MIQDEFTFETYTFSTWQWWVMIREHHMFNSITNMQDSEATNTSFAGPHPSISSNISETTTEGSLAMPKSASLARGRTSYSEGVTWEVLLVLLPWIGWNPDAPCMDCIYIYRKNMVYFTYIMQSISTKFSIYTEHMGLLLSFPDHLSHTQQKSQQILLNKMGIPVKNAHVMWNLGFVFFDGTFGAECIPASWVGCTVRAKYMTWMTNNKKITTKWRILAGFHGSAY